MRGAWDIVLTTFEKVWGHPKHITNNSPQTVYFRIKTTNRPDILYQSTVSMHH